jgi:cell division septum initiation protein DivIVA
VSVHDTLDELVALIEGARSMPMSSSCVVNRADVLGLLDEVRAQLPEEIDRAEQVLRRRESVVESGRTDAERIVADAHDERMRLVSQTEVYAQAQHEASRIRAEAEAETRRRRDEIDAYVDGKLAMFEITLNKTLSAVTRGRERLRDEHATDPVDERPLPGV